MKDKVIYTKIFLIISLIGIIVFGFLIMMFNNFDIMDSIYISSNYMILLPASVCEN